ncbi:facilitated trehalose transporter Tret1-like [Panulirus ornatus]|uniref:facilitated trehalose transporter Tret1-like n=1 Tax=Panulirus ornatus TaxID=150431 RepID=UPI003A8A0D28
MAEVMGDTAKGGPVTPKEVLFVTAVAATTVLNGQVNGWGAVLPKLQEDTRYFTVTDEDVSWLVSLASITGLLITLVSGPLIEYFGPKRLLLSTLIPGFGCWFLMSFTPYLSLLYVGRAGTASSAIFLSTIVQPLLAELSPVKIRGLVSTFPEISGSVGMLLSFVLAYLMAWDVATAVSAAPLIPAILLMFFVPESPYWLVRRGRVDDARSALHRLRGPKANIAEELSAIMSTPTCTQASVRDQFVELRKSQNVRPVMLLLSLFVLRELGGRNAIFQYTVYVFRKADVEMDAFTCTILVGVTRLLCTSVSASTLDRVGRRPLLLVTATVCAVSEAVSGIFLHLELPGASWVPLVAVLTFVASYGIGLGPVPWVYLGELLPNPVRSLGVSIVTFFYIVTLFGVNYTFLKIISYLGLGMTFMIFATCNLVLAAITWQWIPESRGVTLQELEQAFSQQAAPPKEKEEAPLPTPENPPITHSVPEEGICRGFDTKE